jgi:hypothetical protein
VRKAAADAPANAQAKWKVYYDLKVGAYTTKKDAFDAALAAGAGWATYEANGVAERARVAAAAVLTKEKAKATT